MRPRTKHINVKYHHFWDYINCGEISIHAISTLDQPVDILTKPLNEATLAKHHHTIMGWGRKGNAERECEDPSIKGIQQCHKPAGSPGQVQQIRPNHQTRPNNEKAHT